MDLATHAAGVILTVYIGLVVIRYGLDLLTRLRVMPTPLPRSAALAAEVLYKATDPPLKTLNKRVPPVRIGSVAFDLGFLLLLIVLSMLNAIVSAIGS